jgi:hypothetical protein
MGYIDASGDMVWFLIPSQDRDNFKWNRKNHKTNQGRITVTSTLRLLEEVKPE